MAGYLGYGISRVSEAVLAELNSNNLMVTTVMEIQNDTKHNLINGSIYAVKGNVLLSPLAINANSSDVVATRKTKWYPTGTEGILSYTFENNPERKIVVSWSAPFNFHIFDNRLGVGVTSGDIRIDQDMFEEMNAGNSVNRLEYRVDSFTSSKIVPVSTRYKDVVVEGTMSSDHKAHVKIHIRSEVV
ncbi:ACTP-like protein [Mya arenaria]|uniref:ACTP-like protein n=1 Tax=Mya arenaria TaxID=6604 RepID=A0ABY7GFC2_MYAAR|nr:conoporin-Cn1-like [Mya arenaria]XP_052787067.1 conoporin-Cn1-like [Mya arenaria]WAR29906.1 ACTP-like protein [Mya arenaria]